MHRGGCWSLLVDGGGGRWLPFVLVVLVGARLCLLLVLVHAHGSWSPFLSVGGGWPWFHGGHCH